MHLMGLDIVTNETLDNQPRMTVSTRFAELMPPEFVADLNTWMREFFGTENKFYVLDGRRLICGPKGLEQVRAAEGIV